MLIFVEERQISLQINPQSIFFSEQKDAECYWLGIRFLPWMHFLFDSTCLLLGSVWLPQIRNFSLGIVSFSKKRISPGTEDVSDAATVFVAVAGKYGVDKATNKKENDII